NKRIGFRTVGEALPVWVKEAKEMLEKENSNR
ncbi:RNA-binding protein, partial [Listeria monocytogenes]|nr:RNA-binding protein [Listeria monocytogenes]